MRPTRRNLRSLLALPLAVSCLTAIHVGCDSKELPKAALPSAALPAAPPATPPAAPPAAPEGQEAKFWLKSVPPKAAVRDGDQEIGLTPLELSARKKPWPLTLTHKGYADMSVVIVPGQQAAMTVNLEKAMEVPEKAGEAAAIAEDPTPVEPQDTEQTMDALISKASALSTEDLEELGDDSDLGWIGPAGGHEFWFLEKKKNPCPSRDSDASDYIGVPDAEDEFELHEKLQKRKQLKKETLAKVFKIPAGEVTVGPYDFKRSSRTLFVRSAFYTFTGRGKAECPCEWDPDERKNMCEPCSWETTPLGKKPAKDALKLKFSIAAAKAKQIGDEEDAYTVTVLARVKGVYRHNKCAKVCASFLGITSCGKHNIGAGGKLHGSLVAVRVEAQGETVFEKVYGSGRGKPRSKKKKKKEMIRRLEGGVVEEDILVDDIR